MVDLLPPTPSDADIIAAVERWIDDLSGGDFDGAYSRTEHDDYYGWSPALIRAVVTGYGFPEPHPNGPFLVTPRDAARGQRRASVERLATSGGTIAHVAYDLPLNGEWSDLTATFSVERRAEGSVLVLEEIHVL